MLATVVMLAIAVIPATVVMLESNKSLRIDILGRL
jgi:hypothetical protein